MAIKKDAFRDMGSKLKDGKHSLKSKLKITDDDTLETVRTRMDQIFLNHYDHLDFEVLLDKLCSKRNKVGHDLVKLLFCVVSLIIIVLYLIRFLF
jgi:hypothetical protein